MFKMTKGFSSKILSVFLAFVFVFSGSMSGGLSLAFASDSQIAINSSLSPDTDVNVSTPSTTLIAVFEFDDQNKASGESVSVTVDNGTVTQTSLSHTNFASKGVWTWIGEWSGYSEGSHIVTVNFSQNWGKHSRSGSVSGEYVVLFNGEPIVDPITPSIEAPTLVAPLNDSVVKGDLLVNEWSEVDGAVKYIYNSYHDADAEGLRWNQEVIAPDTSKSATNVSDATFWWRVKAVDGGETESEWSELWKVTVDNTAPVVEITQPVDGSTVRGIKDVRGSVEDDNLWRYYAVVVNSSNNIVAGPGTVYEDEAFEDNSLFEWDTTSVSDGVYTIRLEARDKADNKDGGSVHVITVTVDNLIEQEPATQTPRPRGSSFIAFQGPDTPDIDGGQDQTDPKDDIAELLDLLDGARLALLDLENQLQQMLSVGPDTPLAEPVIPPVSPATFEGGGGEVTQPVLAVIDEDALPEDDGEEIIPISEENAEGEDSSQVAAAFMGISSSWLNLITRFVGALAVSVGLYFGWAYFRSRRRTWLK